jgi:hypothetical protein
MMRLARNNGYFALPVNLPDAFHRADARRGIADYDVLHACPLSSKTIAPFGQPFTHAGFPSFVATHSSHFCTAPSSDGDTAPYGQLKMQVKQLTHLSRSIVTTPSVTVNAPVMQLFTHNGSRQCRHETAKLTPSFSSITIFELIFMSLSARAMSFSAVPEKAQ